MNEIILKKYFFGGTALICLSGPTLDIYMHSSLQPSPSIQQTILIIVFGPNNLFT